MLARYLIFENKNQVLQIVECKLSSTGESFTETRGFASQKLFYKYLPKTKANEQLKRIVLPFEV